MLVVFRETDASISYELKRMTRMTLLSENRIHFKLTGYHIKAELHHSQAFLCGAL